MELSFKKKYASLDTCILLRILERDNEEQARRAIELLLSGQDFFIEDAVIMETVFVLTKAHWPRINIVESLNSLLDNPQIQYNKTFFAPIFETYSSHPSLSFNDCIIAASAERKSHTPLWTFDRKLAHQSPTARLLAEP